MGLRFEVATRSAAGAAFPTPFAARALLRCVTGLLLVATLGAMPSFAGADESPGERGRTLEREGRLEQALAVYDAWLERAPDEREAQLARARVLGWLERTEEALAAVDLLLARHPDDAEARVLRARMLGWMGRYAEADEEAERALELAPAWVEVHLVQGDLHAWQQRTEDAERCYAEALRLAPEDQRAALRLGRSLRRQGREEEARVAFERALEIDGESPEALAALRQPERLRRFRLDAGFRVDVLDDGEWWHEHLQLDYRVAAPVSVRAGVEQYHRFGEDDTQWTLGATWAMPRGWLLDGQLALGMNVDVVARTVVEVDLSRRLGETWSAGLRYRHSRFPDDVQANLFSPQLEFSPFAPAWVLLRYSLTRVTGGNMGHCGTLRVGLFPEARLSPGVGFSYGTEAFAASSVGATRTYARIFSASTDLVWRVRDHLGLRLGFEYEKLHDTYERRGVATGLFARF